MTDAGGLEEIVRRLAREEGFDAVGIARPEAGVPAGERLRAWVAHGAYGDMGWMAETLDRRADPRTLWPDMRSVVLLGLNYGPSEDPRAVLARKSAGAISVYARAEDYHDIIKPKLKRVARGLLAEAGRRGVTADVKVFVDTAPLMEKPLAAAAGLGWQGRHTNIVSREFGSWLFLGAIATTLELKPDAPEKDRCGSCRACLDACPTAAFPAPYVIDARRCISYLTIEHKGPIPAELRLLMGNRIYGCDDCLAACPWNKFAQMGQEAKLAARAENDAPPLAELVALDDAAFRARFPKSPIKRVGRDRFVRNVLIAIGNSGDAALLPLVEARLADESAVVRGAAVWALGRLADPSMVARLAAERGSAETDTGVSNEWIAVTSGA
ncbi:tRNA epoxyqueuosine(34) reductase QueG [Xanthobacter flavus]|uniref:tRNA epoxyqueuosine(34) reductase QueG n=1 Tax=Xanthobacter flavus TaxID=281 RepID=UPI002493506E|nr:tRNA epoxyqueuosine(34) reductase QueG [Xanthobacter flavus]